MARKRIALAGVVAGLALAMVPAPASAVDTVVGHLARPSTIRTYAGIQVFSAFDGGAYRLAIRRGGRVRTAAGRAVASAV